MMNTGEK